MASLETRVGRLEGLAISMARSQSLPTTPAELMAQTGLESDSWQLQLLTNDAPQIILNCCRQSGKSTAVAYLAVWTALTHPQSLILCIAPSLRQSQELFAKVMGVYGQLDGVPTIRRQSALRAEFSNGSRVVVLPDSERTTRGYSAVTLLLIDEASGVLDETYYSLRPMLAVSRSQDAASGRLVLLSTPRGQRGFFWDVWRNGGSDWLRIQVTADEVDRIDAEFLEQERRELGDIWFRQEYHGEFLAPQNAVFDYAAVDAAGEDNTRPLVDSPLLH